MGWFFWPLRDAINASISRIWPSPTKTTVDCSECGTKSLQGCSVTVGEFESCLTELVGYFEMLSCADAGKTPPIPPSCYSSLMSRCESIFSSSSS
jgi:hypothetical protein